MFFSTNRIFFDPSDNGYPYVGCTVGDNYSNSMTQFYNTIRQSTEDQCVYASPQAGLGSGAPHSCCNLRYVWNAIRQSTEDQCVYASPQAGRQCVWGLELHTPAAIYAMECNIRADIKSPPRLIFDMYVDSITIIFRWYFLRRLLRQE